MDHHLFREDNLKIQCYHCGKTLNSKTWNSEFHKEFHYKSTTCECGRQLSVKVDFIGSGHDSWDKTNSWKKTVHEELCTEKTSMKILKNLVELAQQKTV